MIDVYPVPATTSETTLEIKRSRFVTRVYPVENRSAAQQCIAQLRRDHPDANHHCWAMIAGAPFDDQQHDQSDDGEPRGTAGKPMLNVLQHAGLGNVLVVVTRYFGGIKLGAGGLVRAYTGSVTAALENLETRNCHIREDIWVRLPYAQLGMVEYWLQSTDCVIAEKQFDESVRLCLQVPQSECDAVREKLQQMGNGRFLIESP